MTFIRQLLTDCRSHPLYFWCTGGCLAALALPIIAPDWPETTLVSALIILIVGFGLVVDSLFDILKL